MTSVVGVQGNAGQANYAAAKAGMIGMSKALAAEVATRGITVNCIAPGFIESPMTRTLDQKQRDAILASIPTRTPGFRQGDWRGGRVFGELRSGLRDRADASCERRNGNDLRALDEPQDRVATGLAPSRVGWKDMLSTPVVAGRGRGESSKRRRRRTRTNLLPHQARCGLLDGETSSSGEIGRGIDHKSGGGA